MCSFEGWDITVAGSQVFLSPHSCMKSGACGHEVISLEKAVDQVIFEYTKLIRKETDPKKQNLLCVEQELWESGNHPVYKFYKGEL